MVHRLQYQLNEINYRYLLQGPWLDWFIDVANDHPYLWALYAFAIVMPFVVCAAFCVRSQVCYTIYTMHYLESVFGSSEPFKLCVASSLHCIH